MEKTGMFQESPGVTSYVRVAGFILLIATLIIMGWHEVKHRGTSDEVYSDGYCYFLIIAYSFAFFPKVMQKIVEAVLQVRLGNKVDSLTTETTQKTTATVTDKQV